MDDIAGEASASSSGEAPTLWRRPEGKPEKVEEEGFVGIKRWFIGDYRDLIRILLGLRGFTRVLWGLIGGS